MATNDLLFTRAPGEIVESGDFNSTRKALLGDFVGRDDPTGAVTPKQRLGTPTIPWGETHTCRLFINGIEIDPKDFIALPNEIVAGATRTTSKSPDFLRADGATNSFTLLAATTNLDLVINNEAVTYNTDIVKTSLILAPSTNNTADIDDTTLTGSEYTKWQGEDGTILTIDNAGTEITDRIGQCASFKHGTSEIFFGFIKSATEIVNVFRGFNFDDTGTPIQREVMSNNDTITLLETGWVFLENDASTIDVSYLTPIVDFVEPSSPATGQYWLDLATGEWKRFSGASFDVINRIPVGLVVIDTANAIGTRSFDFNNSFKVINTFGIEGKTDSIVKSEDITNLVSVYGTSVRFDHTFTEWDISTDLESGFTEAADTVYFLYLSCEGESILSPIKPYDRPELLGKYHPYNSWRYIGYVVNDSGSDFTDVGVDSQSKKKHRKKLITATETFFIPPFANVDVELWGGGGGGAGAAINAFGVNGGGGSGYVKIENLKLPTAQEITVTVGAGGAGGPAGFNSGANGGTSTFGATGVDATGGDGANFGVNFLAVGGTGSGGDLNLRGDQGGTAYNDAAVDTGRYSGKGGMAARGSAGAQSIVNGTDIDGIAGQVPGGGGSGGFRNGASNRAGGSGADGLAKIRWFG